MSHEEIELCFDPAESSGPLAQIVDRPHLQ